MVKEEYYQLREIFSPLKPLIFSHIYIEGDTSIIKQPGIIVANHPGWKDVYLLGMIIKQKITFIADSAIFYEESLKHKMNEVLFKKRGMSKLEKTLREALISVMSKIIPKIVEKSGAIKLGENYKTTYRKAREIIENKGLLCIFPERRGEKKEGEAIKRFQPGIGMFIYDLYQKAIKHTIYPLAIWYEKGVSYLFRDKAYIRILSPIKPENLIEKYGNNSNKRKSILDITKRLEEIIKENIKK